MRLASWGNNALTTERRASRMPLGSRSVSATNAASPRAKREAPGRSSIMLLGGQVMWRRLQRRCIDLALACRPSACWGVYLLPSAGQTQAPFKLFNNAGARLTVGSGTLPRF